MPVDADGRVSPGGRSPAPDALQLDAAATEFYADLRLSSLLRQVLRHSGRLLDAAAGSISIIDPDREHYVKVAEYGASCRLGQRFSLGEGITGRVADRRCPVVLDRYGDLGTGHLPAAHRVSSGSALAVPIWWRGDVVGANVVFAGTRRRFTLTEVEELELLTQVGAPAIVRAGTADPSLAHLVRSSGGGATGRAAVRTVVTEVGAVRALPPAVTRTAVDLVRRAEEYADGADLVTLRVALVHRSGSLRILLQEETTSHLAAALAEPATADGWRALVARVGGELTVDAVPGWGTLVCVDLPRPVLDVAVEPPPDVPLTAREAQVLALLAEGCGDRELAGRLGISPRTVEKHVGSLLRRTGTGNRTAAVMAALDRGWLPQRTPAAMGEFPHGQGGPPGVH